MKSMRKSKAFKIVFPLLSIGISIYFIPWLILQTWLTPLPSTIQEQLDLAEKFKLDGIIVHIDQGRMGSQTYTSGWHNRKDSIHAKGDALFKIASIGKMYVAAAITKLATEGRISVDSSFANYLPGIAANFKHSEDITIRSMVMHKSGLPNYVDHPDFPWDNPPQSEIGHLKFAYEMEQEFAPMEDSSYSNTNYLLLTLLMDSVLGYSHHRYIEEQILKPLHLDQTYMEMNQVDPERVMSGYYIGYEPDIKGNYFGSMVATASDVGKFLRSFQDGTLFTEEELALYKSMYVTSHTGLLPGYQSIARYYPDLDAVVVQFTNTNGGYAWNIHTIIHNKVVRILRKSTS